MPLLRGVVGNPVEGTAHSTCSTHGKQHTGPLVAAARLHYLPALVVGSPADLPAVWHCPVEARTANSVGHEGTDRPHKVGDKLGVDMPFRCINVPLTLLIFGCP